MTPAKLVSDLPESIRVGPFTMRLVPMESYTANAMEVFGYFKRDEQVIAFEANPSTREGIADTLQHEINHAIWWAYGIQEGDNEERTVAAFATAWTQIYRDNPWLLDWLKKALK